MNPRRVTAPRAIDELVLPVSTWNPEALGDETFKYVDIASIDRDAKIITSATALRGGDAPSRARQLVRACDVLVSTVRPALNAVAMVAPELDGATASTGLTVLRADPTQLDGRYLFQWVRTAMFVDEMVRRATGASYPAVSDRIVRQSSIPLPPVAEQRRIADLLDRTDAVRRKRREALALTEDLLRSTFLEMFGDPVTNPKGWPMRSVLKLSESTQYGTAEKANEEGRGLPVLRMGNLTYEGRIDLGALKHVELSAADQQKLDLRDGDVLFNRTNSIELVGKTAAWHHGPGFTFAGYLIRLRMTPKVALGDYVVAAMNSASGKRLLRATAKPSINMANLSTKDLGRIVIAVPPLALQQRFRSVASAIQAQRAVYARALGESDRLFAALVDRAFRGN